MPRHRRYQKYGRFVRAAASQIDPDPDFVEDVAQEFLASMPRRIRRYGALGSLFGWLGVAVPRFSINCKRSLKPVASLDALGEHDHDALDARLERALSDEGAAAEEMLRRIDRPEHERLLADILPAALESLKPEWRLLLVNKYCHGLTNREIARTILKTHERNVSKWLAKARKAFAKRALALASQRGAQSREDLRHSLERLEAER